MKVNLDYLQRSLFRGSTYYLDMHTGDTCSEYLIQEGLSVCPERFVILPKYSNAPIYQEYLNTIFSEYSIEDTLGFNKYPKFDILLKPTDERYIEFMDKAYYFIVYDLPVIIRDAPHLTDEQKRSIPAFDDYSRAYRTCIAMDWCKKEGYEWIEE